MPDIIEIAANKKLFNNIKNKGRHNLDLWNWKSNDNKMM